MIADAENSRVGTESVLAVCYGLTPRRARVLELHDAQ